VRRRRKDVSSASASVINDGGLAVFMIGSFLIICRGTLTGQ
jgi:hypothetical protein